MKSKPNKLVWQESNGGQVWYNNYQGIESNLFADDYGDNKPDNAVNVPPDLQRNSFPQQSCNNRTHR